MVSKLDSMSTDDIRNEIARMLKGFMNPVDGHKAKLVVKMHGDASKHDTLEATASRRRLHDPTGITEHGVKEKKDRVEVHESSSVVRESLLGGNGFHYMDDDLTCEDRELRFVHSSSEIKVMVPYINMFLQTFMWLILNL
jgi:hypothetical protein